MSLYSGFNQSMWNAPITSKPAHNTDQSIDQTLKQSRKHQPHSSASYQADKSDLPVLSSPINQSPDQSVSHSRCDSTHNSNYELRHIDEQTLLQTINRSMNQPNQQSVKQSASPLPALIGDQTRMLTMIHPPAKPYQPVKQAIKTVDTITHSTIPAVVDSIEWTEKDVVVPAIVPINQSIKQPVYQSIQTPYIKHQLATIAQVYQHHPPPNSQSVNQSQFEEKEQMSDRSNQVNDQAIDIPALGVCVVPVKSRHAIDAALMIVSFRPNNQSDDQSDNQQFNPPIHQVYNNDSPAQKSGLNIGDVILSINDLPIGQSHNQSIVQSIERALNMNQYVALRVSRDARRNIGVTVKTH